MDLWAIEGGRALFEWGWFERGVVYIEGDKVVAIGGGVAEGCASIDVDGGYVVPGFIDMHVHGGGGASVWDAETAAVETILRTHAVHGTTGLLLTTYPAEPEHLEAQVMVVRPHRPSRGAVPLGIHLEGPHVNPRRMGGLAPPERLYPLTKNMLSRLTDVSGVPVRLVTLAPEVEGTLELVSAARRLGILCAISHTEATFDQTKAAINAGCTDATHIFNTFAFPPNGRSPGALEACMVDDRIRAHIISDMIHIHPVFIRIILRLKGSEKTVLITDARKEAATPDAPPVVRSSEGRILGSTLTMGKAVEKMVKVMGVPLEDAVKMASTVPAAAMGLKKGVIKPGWDADIVVLDEDLSVVLVVVSGVVVHSRGVDVKGVASEV